MPSESWEGKSSTTGKANPDHKENTIRLVVASPPTAGNPGLYIGTAFGGRGIAWVALNKADAIDLAARIAYMAQFLEDEN